MIVSKRRKKTGRRILYFLNGCGRGAAVVYQMEKSPGACTVKGCSMGLWLAPWSPGTFWKSRKS